MFIEIKATASYSFLKYGLDGCENPLGAVYKNSLGDVSLFVFWAEGQALFSDCVSSMTVAVF